MTDSMDPQGTVYGMGRLFFQERALPVRNMHIRL